MILECIIASSLLSCTDDNKIDDSVLDNKLLYQVEKDTKDKIKERKKKQLAREAKRIKQEKLLKKRQEEERRRQQKEAERKRIERLKAEQVKKRVKRSAPATSSGSKQIMEITGYTAGYESTQKQKGQEGYGITASGNYVQQGVTIAAGRNIPFGTKILIPYFKGKPGFGDGVFTVQDRGGAIGANKIDVFFNSLPEAQAFGRRTLEVYILGG